MNLHSLFSPRSILALTLAGATAATQGAPVDNKTPRARVAETNLIAKSVYNVPTSADLGRDPFFPNSSYMRGGAIIQPRGPMVPISLILNGVSGGADHRLCIINGHTLAEGEESEIQTANSRDRIRCVQIKGESVIIEVRGERRELRLRE